MGFGTAEAVSAGLAKDHYDEYFHHPEIACEECHSGPGLSGMVDAKVIQAVHKVYQYFVLQDRDFPKSGTYPSENCMKEDCHPVAGDVHNVSISAKECRDCHKGHNNVHDSAKKAALLGSINCVKCHSEETVAIHQELSKDCQDCHSTEGVVLTHQDYETSQNYSECHGEPHGPELTSCSECHTNAYAPLNISVPATDCANCHEDPKATLEANPSSHTEMECTSCHNQTKQFDHGYIPNCSSCHGEPHGANATGCYDCHIGGHKPTVGFKFFGTPHIVGGSLVGAYCLITTNSNPYA